MAIYNGPASGAGGLRAGIAFLEINGEALDVVGDLAYDTTFVKREMLLGQSGVQGYSEMPKPGSISGTIRDAGNLSQAAFMDMTSVPIVARLANGKSVYGDTMTCTECSEVKTQEGSFTVKFEGLCTESST